MFPSHDRSPYIGSGQVGTLKQGVYGFANSATHPIAATDVGTDAYVEGTTGFVVCKSGTSHTIKAGRVESYDATNSIVYVNVGRNA